MLKRRIVIIMSCLLLFLNSLVGTGVVATTTIGQDMSIVMPLKSEMENEADLSLIRSDVTTTTSGAVVLSVDKVSGKFSTVVTLNDMPNTDNVNYTIVQSDNFDISNYSQVKIWIKPGRGANWIEFYTNNSLIKSNINQDGRFKVGKDLVSGKWNEVVLDLTKNAKNLTTGNSLEVKTNDNSTWGFDNISTEKAIISNVDLMNMVNSKTNIIDGMLRFKKVNGVYDTGSTILTSDSNLSSENVVFNRTDGITEFSQGTFDWSQIGPSTIYPIDCIKFGVVDLCFGGTAISGGYISGANPINAVDNNTSTSWKSSQTGANVSGEAYIGYDFTISRNIKFIKIRQSGSSNTSIDSVKLQHYDNSTSNWVDVQTLSLVINNSDWQAFKIDADISATKWRLLANGNTTNYWCVNEIEMGSRYGYHDSTQIDLSTVSESINDSKISWKSTTNPDVTVYTRLSLDNGVTWGPFTKVANNSEIPGISTLDSFSNVKLQYRVVGDISSSKQFPELYEVSLSIYSNDATYGKQIENGRITKIDVESNYVGLDGIEKNLQDKHKALTTNNDVKTFALSGDGKVLYYPNASDGGKLYKLNILSGKSTKISEHTSFTSIKTNYDGSIIAYITHSSLFLYDTNLNEILKLISSSVNEFTLQENGSLVYTVFQSSYSNGSKEIWRYFDNESILIYSNSSATDSHRFTCSTSNTGNLVFYSDKDGKIFSSSKTANVWKDKELYDADTYISRIYSNKDGTMLYLGFGLGTSISPVIYYSFDVESKAIRKLDLVDQNSTIIKVTDDDKLVYLSGNRLLTYDPVSNHVNEITPLDRTSSSTAIDINTNGSVIAYNAPGFIKINYLKKVERPEKYLLSFDGKNSWHTYKNSTWQLVESGQTPDMNDFSTYGMTVDEVNALSESDFKPLYEDGRQVYCVDFAIYLTSIDTSTSPNIKSIKIITNESKYDVTNNLVGQAVYAAKKQDFTGENWRKINRLYPVETCPKEASFYYFMQVDGKYSYYDGGEWKEETNNEITNMLTDVEGNWSSIIEKGMTTEQLKTIPKEALTQKLVHKNFSVVYCMRVMDVSTEKYSSKIVADYVEELFASESLVLKITTVDGSIKEYTGLTKLQVEEFMEWINRRQHNVGPVFYTIKTENTSYFVNYYMIQSVTVDEL